MHIELRLKHFDRRANGDGALQAESTFRLIAFDPRRINQSRRMTRRHRLRRPGCRRPEPARMFAPSRASARDPFLAPPWFSNRTQHGCEEW